MSKKKETKKENYLLGQFCLEASQVVLRGFVLLGLGNLFLNLGNFVENPHTWAGGRGASTIYSLMCIDINMARLIDLYIMPLVLHVNRSVKTDV